MSNFKIPVHYIVTSEYLLDVEAETRDEAIKKAKFLIKYLVENNLYDDITLNAMQIDEQVEVMG